MYYTENQLKDLSLASPFPSTVQKLDHGVPLQEMTPSITPLMLPTTSLQVANIKYQLLFSALKILQMTIKQMVSAVHLPDVVELNYHMLCLNGFAAFVSNVPGNDI